MTPIEKPALLSDERIEEWISTIATCSCWGTNMSRQQAQRFARAIESEVSAPLLARIEELEKDAARLTLSRIDKECLRIGQQVHRAAADLPYGYEIEIELERGSGSVYLSNPDYSKVAFNDHVDGFSESIGQAIDAALSATKEPS